MESFSLSQIVTGCTHVSQKYSSLVFVSSVTFIKSCSVIRPLANSDHYGLLVKVNTCLPTMNKKSRKVWCYKHADFTKAHQLLLDIDWYSLLINDIDIAWANWYKAFMEVMKKCIPRRQLPINQRNIPWINKKITQAMKRRNCLYKNSRKSTTARSKYQLARNRVVSHIGKQRKNIISLN